MAAIPSSEPFPDSAAAAAAQWAQAVASTELSGPPQLADRLAAVCTQLLHADGVCVSLRTEGFRRPVGSSGPAAAAAESAEFGLGDGPSLSASPLSVVFADAEQLTQHWPAFSDALIEHGPYRSMLSVGLPGLAGVAGRMDAYFVAASCDQVPLQAALLVAALVAEELNQATPVAEDSYRPGLRLGPAWLHSPLALGREQVWVATGMLQAYGGTGIGTALALLRGYAFAHGQLLDELADALVSRQLPIEDVAA